MRKLSDVGMKVLESRYLCKDEQGKIIETPDELVTRVATAIGHAEALYVDKVGCEKAQANQQVFFSDCDLYMSNLEFLPNSPTLMNAGTPGGQLSACFLVPVADDIESIFDAVKAMAMIFKSGGGVGLPMSRLRPKGSHIKSTGGKSSGPISFMRVYNTTAEVVAQGGKRRGALMGTLRIDHPDIREFIRIKQDLKELTSFNLSVAVTDEFMSALASGGSYNLVDPHTGNVTQRVVAQAVWDEIVECAWKTGEPGLVFIDLINQKHREVTGIDTKIEGTNPCVTGDTMVRTRHGELQPVRDLVGRPVDVEVWGRLWRTEGFFSSGFKKVFSVNTHSGLSVRATADHMFFRYDGDVLNKVKLSDLKPGDELPLDDPFSSPNSGSLYPSSWRTDVVSIVEHGEEEVYDIQVPGVNAFVANGIVVGNCGEVPLLGYESCNLGSINLSEFVVEPFTDNARVNTNKLAAVAKFAVRFLDNVITVNTYPLSEIRQATLSTRKIGIGVMGFAEMLLKMGIRYGSIDSSNVLANVMRQIAEAAESASVALAVERGEFPACTAEKGKPGWRRNATLTAIAPTGSISMIADVTGGIEPMFAIAMKRQSVLDGEVFVQMNSTVLDLLIAKGWNPVDAEHVMSDIALGQSFEDAAGLYKNMHEYVVCAHEVPPREHVAMQAAAQAHVHNAVSKSTNLPNHALPWEVYEVFIDAYHGGCKGITVYRDGCRENQPMSTAKQDKPVNDKLIDAGMTPIEGKVGVYGDWSQSTRDQVREWMAKVGIGPTVQPSNPKIQPKQRPVDLPGRTIKMTTGCGTLFVTVNMDENGNPIELFAHHGKAGVCSQAQCEAIGRLSSMSLRAGVDPQAVISQLQGITCHETAGMGPNKVLSCADGIAKAIVKALGAMQVKEHPIADDPSATHKAIPVFSGACPKCGAGTIREAGCVVCKACGWEKCS